MQRHGNTAKEILAAGDFAKLGKKHYRHVSGLEIAYDHKRYSWRACGKHWGALWVAVYEVRRAAARTA